MTRAQASMVAALLDEHGDAPVSASAEGGVVLVFVRGVVFVVGEDGTAERRAVTREAAS